MHKHVTAVDFLIFAAFFLILKLAITLIATKYPENSFSKALGALA